MKVRARAFCQTNFYAIVWEVTKALMPPRESLFAAGNWAVFLYSYVLLRLGGHGSVTYG